MIARLLNGSFAACVLAAFVAGSAGCSKPLPPEQYMAQAKAFQRRHDFGSSIIELKNVLGQQPDNGEARYLLGLAYNRTGDYAAAEIELERALRLDHQPTRAMLALGKALANKREHGKALDKLAVIEREKGSLPAELHVLRGNLKLELRDADAAAAFATALRQVPGLADAHLGLARVAIAGRDLDRAAQEIESALAAAPQHVEALLLKGDLLRSRSRPAEAEQAYRRASTVDPLEAAPRLRLAELHSATNNLQAAHAEVGRVLKTEPRNLEALYGQAVAYLREAKYAQAEEAIQNVLKASPEHMKSMLVAGAAAYHLGKTGMADKYLTSYLKRFPKDAYARRLLALNLLDSDQPGQALEVLGPLLSASPDARVLAIAGHAARRSNSLALAERHLSKAAELAPKNAGLHTELALVKLSAGETNRGMKELETAARLAPQKTGPEFVMVGTHLVRQDYDKALGLLAEIEKKQPADPRVANLRGAALVGKKRTDEARASFSKALSLQADFYPAANNLAALEMGVGNPAAARAHLESYLKKNADSSTARLALADLAAVTGKEEQRLEWLEAAAKAAPQATQPQLALASYHAQKKDYATAIKIVQRLHTSRPQDPAVLETLGSLRTSAGDREGAVTAYQSLLRLRPDSAQGWYRLALLQIDGNDPAGARTSLNKAVNLDSRHQNAWMALAALEIRSGRYDEATAVALEAGRREPKLPWGKMIQGDVHMAQRDFAGAVQAYKAALLLAEDPALFVRAHDALLRAGRPDDAARDAQRWMAAHPADNAARVYLADAESRAGRHRVAIAHYEKVLESSPSHVVALNNLAGLYQREGDPRAASVAERAYAIASTEANVLDTLGWILVHRGDAKRGHLLLQEAVNRAPRSPVFSFHLAASHAKSGDKAKARELLDVLISGTTDFPERADALALRRQL